MGVRSWQIINQESLLVDILQVRGNSGIYLGESNDSITPTSQEQLVGQWEVDIEPGLDNYVLSELVFGTGRVALSGVYTHPEDTLDLRALIAQKDGTREYACSVEVGNEPVSLLVVDGESEALQRARYKEQRVRRSPQYPATYRPIPPKPIKQKLVVPDHERRTYESGFRDLHKRHVPRRIQQLGRTVTGRPGSLREVRAHDELIYYPGELHIFAQRVTRQVRR